MADYCLKCGKKFSYWRFWEKVRYQNRAKTVHIGGEEKTFYWKDMYCMACVRKHDIR